MNYADVLNNARQCIGQYCKACPVCNGVACKNQIPGPGAKGVGDTAIRNYNKWAEIRVNMDTLCENGTPDTGVELFGKTFKYPFFAGPVGAVNLHYSDTYTDMTYNDVLVRACAENGIAAFTGDGTNPDVMTMATKAIGAAGGCGQRRGPRPVRRAPGWRGCPATASARPPGPGCGGSRGSGCR